jgi:hypothetical protein
MVLAGVGASLILSGSVDGRFVGITTTSKPNDFGIFAVNVYAEFDSPNDHMNQVTGTPQDPLEICVVGGSFFQSPFGTDRPPNPIAFDLFPTLRYDTFASIAVKSYNVNDPGVPEGQPTDSMLFGGGWPGFSDSTVLVTDVGWQVPQSDPQGDAFNPAFVAGDGRVLIGQFSTADGFRIEGKILVQYQINGVSELTEVEFCHDLFVGQCLVCPGDCGNSDGDVGIVDLLALLAEWGLAGTPCDSDGGGVGITDFLALLADWGPCVP